MSSFHWRHISIVVVSFRTDRRCLFSKVSTEFVDTIRNVFQSTKHLPVLARKPPSASETYSQVLMSCWKITGHHTGQWHFSTDYIFIIGESAENEERELECSHMLLHSTNYNIQVLTQQSKAWNQRLSSTLTHKWQEPNDSHQDWFGLVASWESKAGTLLWRHDYSTS